jgi:chaperonin GroES
VLAAAADATLPPLVSPPEGASAAPIDRRQPSSRFVGTLSSRVPIFSPPPLAARRLVAQIRPATAAADFRRRRLRLKFRKIGSPTMKFRPLHDRVVVRRLESEAKSKGGIIIPDTAKEKPQEGEVVAVGPGARNDKGELVALDVKAGDRILFGKWSGTEVKIDGEDLLIMKESDIMGVIDAVATAKQAA